MRAFRWVVASWLGVLAGACGADGEVHAGERQDVERPGRGTYDDVLRRDVTFDRVTLEQRLSRLGDGGTDPEASCLFFDLDGDGAEECAAVLGDGWWGRQWHLVLYGKVDGGWRLADVQSFAENHRGAAGLRTESGDGRTWLRVNRNAGWGTGYSRGVSHLFEMADARLREVWRSDTSGEQCLSTLGLEFGLGPLAVTGSDNGRRITAELAVETFLEPAFVGVPKSLEWRVPMVWYRPPGGERFEPAASQDGAMHDRLFAEAARRWLATHGTAIREQAASGSEAQRRSLAWLERIAGG